MQMRWPDIDFLKEVYPKLLKWHHWWPKNRTEMGMDSCNGEAARRVSKAHCGKPVGRYAGIRRVGNGWKYARYRRR